MSLRSRAASGQGNVGIYLPCVPEQLLDKEMLGFIYLAFQNSFWTRKCWDLFTLRSRTASGQGHAGNTALCSGAASGQGCVKHSNLHLR